MCLRRGWGRVPGPPAERGGGSQGKLILFSGASTRVRGLTAHYSGPDPRRSPLMDGLGWEGEGRQVKEGAGAEGEGRRALTSGRNFDLSF